MNDLMRRVTPEDVVRAYLESVRELKQAFRLIGTAASRVTQVIGGYDIHIRAGYHSYVSPNDLNRAVTELRRDTWRGLIDRLGIRRLMSVKAWKELDRSLSNDEPPEMTIDTVRAMVSQYRDGMEAMLTDSVVEVYKWLRPYDSYRTNTVWEVRQKVILVQVVETGWGDHPWRVSYLYSQDLMALERAAKALDGERLGEENPRSDVETAIMQIPKGERDAVTKHFAIKVFKNGNLHLKFRDMNVVRRLNQIAGKGFLRETHD